MGETLVIVGGDAAGMSAASKAKRDDPDMDVVVFEKGEWVSYAACGMPYYIKGEVESMEDLVAVEPETFREERDIDLHLHHEVVALDVDARTVTVEGPDGETFEQGYDHLLLGTGARALVPPFEGVDLDGVFTLRSMDSAAAIDAYLDEQAPERVGLVGGGYIGLELAEAFDARGLDVTVFEMLPHVLQPFGNEVAPVVEDHLRERGVDLRLETAVDRLVGEGGRVTAIEADGETVPVDVAVVGVGVEPNVELAEEAGIELGETGAIAVDPYSETSAPDVYAAGDCAEATNVVTGDPDHVPLGLTANRRGRAVGQTVAGDPVEGGEIAGTAVVKVFDLEVARTGVIDEERAREHGFDPVSVTIQASSRAHYYPGAEEITVHLVGDRESRRLLGAAMVGEEGVSKRIDTVAAALHAGMTVDEVRDMDLAYAPPFSPVWDPVLTAAKVLSGKLD